MNLGATQTTILEMDGIIRCRASQDKDSVTSLDNHQSSVTTTPEMFKNSPTILKLLKNNDQLDSKSEPIPTSVDPANASSMEMSPRTWSVYCESMKYDRNVEIPESIKNSNQINTNDSRISQVGDKMSILSTNNNSPNCHQQVVTTASVYKQPKQNSLSRTVLSSTLSFLRGNQDEGSLASETTYFHSSFSNLDNMEENYIVKDQDELNTSSERLKRFLEKEADGFFVSESKKKKKNDSVSITEKFDAPLSNAAVLSPPQVQSESKQLSCSNISTENLNITSASSFGFGFQALTDSLETPTRRSVLKLVCTPSPSPSPSPNPNNKCRDISSFSEDSSSKDDVWDDVKDEVWDDVTPSFHITVSSHPFPSQRKSSQTSLFLANLESARKTLRPLSARLSPQTSKKSSYSSFTSAISTSHDPFQQRNSCADYISAEEDLSNNSETIESTFGQLQLKSVSSEESLIL